jgi:putative colanic acid biosynthesis acetyltransferase WcaF
LYSQGRITIGDRTVVSQDCYLCTGTHDYDDPGFVLITKPIAIGADAWLAAGCFVLPGVSIGDGAIVGARSVVTKDIAPWTIGAGNPFRPIRARTPKDHGNGSPNA